MSDDSKLLPHRTAIDNIDNQLLDLMNERAKHARAIGELKGTGVVYRPEREAQVLRRIKAFNTGPLTDEAVARLFREIMSECLAIERPLTIAYLGPEGTFTQLAAMKHFGHAAHTVPCLTVDDSLRLVEARQADYVVAPVENSTEGSVGRTLDLLVNTPLRVCGEVVLRVHHHFLRTQYVDFADLDAVYAHAQALAQCQHWLAKNLPDNVSRVAVSSNAEAAKLAAQNPRVAAIASQAAAEIGHQDTTPSGHDKTSLIVSAPNRAGMLHHIIEPLMQTGISMTKFESRPSRTNLWEYLFFIDIEGHFAEPRIQAALDVLRERAMFIKVLGAYPVAVL